MVRNDFVTGCVYKYGYKFNQKTLSLLQYMSKKLSLVFKVNVSWAQPGANIAIDRPYLRIKLAA